MIGSIQLLIIVFLALSIYGDDTPRKDRTYETENKCIARLVAKGIPRGRIVRLNGSCASPKSFNMSARLARVFACQDYYLQKEKTI